MPKKDTLITCEWDAINTILGGGLRRGTTCLIEEMQGESRGVSGLLGISFLRNGMKKGEGAIVLLSEHTVGEYHLLPPVKELEAQGQLGQLLLMDGLSSLAFGEPITGSEEGVVQCSNIRYTAKFYEELRMTVKKFDRARLYVDSLSVLLHAMESDRAAWQFWLALLPLIQHRHLAVIASFYPLMHSQQFVESIERISDSIIRFTALPTEPGKTPTRQIQVVKNRGLPFSEKIYTYERKGYEYYIKD
ncbi:MAG: RAD55 family ATPase [Candidatus Thorarchaeota archaeon]